MPVAEPGRYRVIVHLTRSYDYAILQPSVNGRPAGDPIDTYQGQCVPSGPIDLGVFDAEGPLRLRLETVGTNEKTRDPHYYFGLDAVVLERQ